MHPQVNRYELTRQTSEPIYTGLDDTEYRLPTEKESAPIRRNTFRKVMILTNDTIPLTLTIHGSGVSISRARATHLCSHKLRIRSIMIPTIVQIIIHGVGL